MFDNFNVNRRKNKGFLTYIPYIPIPEFSIFQFPIMHSVFPQILHKLLLRNALGNMQTSQEYFTTIVYAKFGGQTECIMDNWKIVNTVNRTHPTLFSIALTW